MGKGNIKSDGSYFSHMDYAQTFRRLEKQFENLARSSKPTKRDIEATTVPAGRTLYSVIRKGFLDCLSPPDWLRSETLLPGLVDEEKQPKFDKWKPDEYSVYWVFAMQWLPTANMTSVPNNAGLQWSKWKWSKEQQRAVRVTFDNETDYIKHLQACATMYGEACNLIAGILDTTPAKEEKEKAKTIGSIHIQNFKGILGDVQQPENLQIGDYASIHKQTKIQTKGGVKRLLKIIGAIVGFLAALLTIFHLLGWLGLIKAFIYNILVSK